jgi:oligoendopeptidase F
MAETLKERKEIPVEDTWDLSSLYENDAAWEKAFSEIDEKADAVAGFAGKLKDAQTIRLFLEADTALSLALSDLFCYASLRRSEDTRAAAGQELYSRIMGKYASIAAETAFAVPEILALPEDVLQSLAEDPELADYRFLMEKLLLQKPHTLSAPEEKLLASFSEVLSSPGEIADNLQDADLVFDPVKNEKGEETEVTESNYILLQTSPDRTLRKNSFESFYRTYRQHINTFAATYSANVKCAVNEASVRHYSSSRAMSMQGEHIPEEVYDQLILSVRSHMPTMYRYVDFRRRLLQVSELHYYDVYAPLTKSVPKTYTYPQAQELVLKAVAPLGKEYSDTVRSAFASRWIDVYPNRGKSGGAFSSGTYHSNPYILTNFTGTLESVSTIAHEMGHSMHTYLSNTHQPPQYADYTIFVAEVASTVNENLLIENLLSTATEAEETLPLLNQYLENFKATVYRQTMFAEFEREAHAMAERGETLHPASLNTLYRGLIQDYFGPDLVLDDEVQYEWARIPHFYRPFYVYKYATSYAAAVAISEAILREGRPAVQRYLEFLSMGGSRYPLEELQHAGVDMTKPEPVNTALDKFDRVLRKAEEVAASLHLI